MADPKRLSVPTNPARALRDLSRRQAADAEKPDDNADETTILQSDKPTYRPTDHTTDQQTTQPTNRPADTPTNKKTSLPTDQQTNSPTDRPTDHIRDNTTERGNPSPQTTETPAVGTARPRVDGRTLRARQDTADQTMVTSLRLAVRTVEQLDEFCWRHRRRKQDVVQAALDLYFAEDAASGEEG